MRFGVRLGPFYASTSSRRRRRRSGPKRRASPPRQQAVPRVSAAERARANDELTQLLLAALQSVDSKEAAAAFGPMAAGHVMRFAGTAPWFNRADFYNAFKTSVVERSRAQIDECRLRHRQATASEDKAEALRQLDLVMMRIDAAQDLAGSLGLSLK
jgi:hypothetical protein